MSSCFVIQPFDKGKFDKRFEQVYKPAIEAAGLVAYRVDRDPGVGVPIESIESGIREASVCLADITTDNPNVWYELGFAQASNRPVIMICSKERAGDTYPFDIRHRTVTSYSSDAPIDFEDLRMEITKRINALLAKGETLRQLAESEQVAPVSGLSQPELTVLAVLAGNVGIPDGSVSLYEVQQDAEKANLTKLGFALGMRRLLSKQFVNSIEEEDFNGNSYRVLEITSRGWDWIEANESLFILKRINERSKRTYEITDEDIPF